MIYYLVYDAGQYDIKEAVVCILGLKLVNAALWYIVELLALTFVFWIVAKVNFEIIHIAMPIVCVLAIFIMVVLDYLYNIGTWWYESTMGFAIGVLYAKDTRVCSGWIRRLMPILVIGSISGYLVMIFAYTVDLGVNANYICVMGTMIYNFCLPPVVMFLLSGKKICIKRAVVSFLAPASLYIYMYHNLSIYLVKKYFDYPDTIMLAIMCILVAVFTGVGLTTHNRIVTKINK